jgi:transcription-repair coupling factor (superfamily II helicase)
MTYLAALRNKLIRIPCMPAEEEFEKFEQGFKYTPTADQLNCFRDVAQDMINSTRPMDRLICGDVGFGKTEVAARAIYRAILNNRQVKDL